MTHLILFDDGLGDLTPLRDLRASFELRTGALTTSERLVEQIGVHPAALIVPPDLAELTAERHREPINTLPEGEAFLFVNGRCSALEADPPSMLNAAQVDAEGAVVVARLDRAAALAFVESGARTVDVTDGVSIAITDTQLITRPWHVMAHAERNLTHDLEALAKRLRPLVDEPAPRVTIVGEHPALIGEGAIVHPHVVFDTTDGPILIDDGAVMRSMSVMVGPGYVGPGSVVCNHAHIRAGTVIGPHCKVGGEVNGCVFQGFANKAHSGFLGNSHVGEWVNLGASTVTSNLKNTYGQVRMQLHPDEPRQDTAMTFLGTIFGDHTKTAIGTRMLTGSCLGTGTMLAVSGFPPKCTDRFAFVTDEGAQRYDFEKFCSVAETMMARRHQSLTPALRCRLESLYTSPLAASRS